MTREEFEASLNTEGKEAKLNVDNLYAQYLVEAQENMSSLAQAVVETPGLYSTFSQSERESIVAELQAYGIDTGVLVGDMGGVSGSPVLSDGFVDWYNQLK